MQVDKPINSNKRIWSKGYRIIFFIVLIFGLLFESLIFIYKQIGNIKNIIANDFRIILITSNNKNYENF